MRCAEAIHRLQKHRDELAALGVSHLALFGSVARDEAGDLSDIDVIVDTADGRAPGLFALARIKDSVERILDRSVDVISRRGLDHAKRLKDKIAGEIVDVF